MGKILEVNNLVKKYGDNTVIKNASLCLESGMIYGLLGPNGAGKTTIMKTLANLIKKDGGSIKYLDSLKIKYLMDVPIFYEYMKVREYLEFIAKLNDLDGVDSVVNSLLVETGLEEHKEKKINQLSRGLRQKLGIASILVNQVDLLMLDEPVSALDPIGRKEVLDIIKSLKNRVCVIFSSHILTDIEKVCDHIIVIDKGNILLNDSSEKLLKNEDILVVKCSNQAEVNLLKDNLEDAKIYDKLEDALLVPYKDLITAQLEIVKLAKKLNLKIEKIEIKKNSLEEVFMSEVDQHE